MGSKLQEASSFHRSGYNCSQAVLCAFCDEIGKTVKEAARIAAPYASGMKVKCGAVLAAELVLEAKSGGEEEKKRLIEDFEKRFVGKNQSVVCRELRSQRLRSCRGCVEDSAEILEEMLKE